MDQWPFSNADGEAKALLHDNVAFKGSSNDSIKFSGRNVKQVANSAKIHAQDWYVKLMSSLRCTQKGSIASETHDQRGRERSEFKACLIFRSISEDDNADRESTLLEARRCLSSSLHCILATTVHDEGDCLAHRSSLAFCKDTAICWSISSTPRSAPTRA